MQSYMQSTWLRRSTEQWSVLLHLQLFRIFCSGLSWLNSEEQLSNGGTYLRHSYRQKWDAVGQIPSGHVPIMFKEGPGWFKVSPAPPSLWTEIITFPPYLSWCPALRWQAIQRELAKLQPPALPGGMGGHPRVIILRCCITSYISEDMTRLFPHSWGENPNAGWWQWRCHRTAGSQWVPRGGSFMQLSRMEMGEMAARQFTGVLIPSVQAPPQSYSLCTSGIRWNSALCPRSQEGGRECLTLQALYNCFFLLKITSHLNR